VIIWLVRPFVPILGAVTDHQQQTSILRGGDQLVQQTKSEGVVPVKVLDDRDDRPYPALAQQQAGERLIGVLPMLGWIEGPERMLVIERIEEIQQRRKRVLQRMVEP
jgi:hypothetical protein